MQPDKNIFRFGFQPNKVNPTNLKKLQSTPEKTLSNIVKYS